MRRHRSAKHLRAEPAAGTAACRTADISYSRFMSGLKRAGVQINRKVLADLAVRDAEAFRQLAEVAKKAL